MLLEDKYARSVLHLLYKNGPMTRKQIMDTLKMRLNSLVAICNELEKERWILREASTQIRNVPLHLNGRRFASVGVEHAGEYVLCVLLDVTGKRAKSARYPISADLGGYDRLNEITAIISDFIQKVGTSHQIVALGFADVGIVNTRLGTGVYSVHVPGWENIPLQKHLEEKFGHFTRVVDRSGASVLDKLRNNPHVPEVLTSLQVYVGRGIGTSILRYGEYFAEDTPSSCQLGHTIARPGGEKCTCGNRGCVETIASIPSILRRVQVLSKGKIADMETFRHQAAQGEASCEQALTEAGEALGIAIANTVTFTAITNVFLRSELCRISGTFFNAVQNTIKRNVLFPFRKHVKVFMNDQQEDCSATGAAYYAQDEFFAPDRENKR